MYLPIYRVLAAELDGLNRSEANADYERSERHLERIRSIASSTAPTVEGFAVELSVDTMASSTGAIAVTAWTPRGEAIYTATVRLDLLHRVTVTVSGGNGDRALKAAIKSAVAGWMANEVDTPA